MNEITQYREYLKKELIPNVKYEISENRIHVADSSTCWCNITSLSVPLEQKAIIKLYNFIVKLARKQHIKLSFKNKTKEKITLFNKCKRYFQFIKKHGIHYGTLDDIILNKAENIKNEYVALFYRNKPLSFIPEIYSHLLEIKQGIEQHPDEYVKICL